MSVVLRVLNQSDLPVTFILPSAKHSIFLPTTTLSSPFTSAVTRASAPFLITWAVCSWVKTCILSATMRQRPVTSTLRFFRSLPTMSARSVIFAQGHIQKVVNWASVSALVIVIICMADLLSATTPIFPAIASLIKSESTRSSTLIFEPNHTAFSLKSDT